MANQSYSLYPSEIDSYGSLPLVRDGVDEILARHHNALRDAIVKLEQELGTQPSGSFATVAARLDSVGDADALISAHLIDSTDAHDASAISILDTSDNYVATNVEDALVELAAILPAALDVIGEDNSEVPNSGIPDFVNKSGILFVFNTSGGANDVKKTQPVSITGVHIIEVGENNETGQAQLQLSNHSPATIQWKAPGDASFGTGVDISGLAEGEIVAVSSDTISKKIRIARGSVPLPLSSPITEDFDICRLDAKTGAYSLDGTGIMDSNYITRTATDSSGTSRGQFVIGGIVYPADKGTLVLQRKLRSSSEFAPIAVLDLSANFDEDNRTIGQNVYVPSLSDFDTITLFDRHPARNDYETLDLDSDGNYIYDNFDLSSTFASFQIAKYIIPAANSALVGGALPLDAPTDITAAEVNDAVSAYRIVHYIAGITDFSGEPNSSDIFSVSDSFGSADDGDNTVRMSNVFLDDDTSRPQIQALVLRPVVDVEVLSKMISGIHYYNSADDLFDVELKTDSGLFDKSYRRNGIIQFTSDAFYFPSGSGFGNSVDVEQLRDDGYTLYSDANLPDFADSSKDHGFYLINSLFNSARRLYPTDGYFSAYAHISGSAYDPFGAGATNDAYGLITSALRILVNSHDRFRATNTEEYFADESRRIGTDETFNFALDREQYTHVYGTNDDGYMLDPWDNTIAIGASELQCGGKFGSALNSPNDSADFIYPGLIYPQDDYTASGIRPTQLGTTDYSAFTGDRYYQRVFNLGYSINSAKLRIVSSGSSLISFNDIAYSNANRFCKIEVKIPGTGLGSTEFMDIGRPYQTNQYEDGDGALVGVTGTEGDFTASFTFGERNNADSGNMIAIRITYLGAQITTAKKKILSLVQLLES